MKSWQKTIATRGTTRRGFLGGAGAVLTLPFLDSLLPRAAQAQAAPAKRLVYYFVPNGIHMPAWKPSADGADYTMPSILKQIEAHRADLLVLSGLENVPGKPDGAGDHAAGGGAFITCAKAKKVESAPMCGISADQVAAKVLGTASRLPSLQLGIEGGSSAGGCDSGYSCAYTRSISWSNATTPLPQVTNVQTVFDRLFQGFDAGATTREREKRLRYRKSVLDSVRADTTELHPKLGRSDRSKMDEFLTGLRDLEKRVNDAVIMPPPSVMSCTSTTRPTMQPTGFEAHVKLMCDLIALAFQCDITRVVSFMQGNPLSQRYWQFSATLQGQHHTLSHHGGDATSLATLEEIGKVEATLFGHLLTKLKGIQEEGGTNALHNSAIFFSSEISDGDRHNHNDLPVLIAGHAGGAIRSGRHVTMTGQKMSNLLLGMMNAAGVPETQFGDSTAALSLA